jgi:hypothetical protein
MPTQCPVCARELRVVRLACGGCGTSLEGRFGLGRLQRLSREQIAFVEVFIKCRGKIKDVEQELGVSYPTVVARLDQVVAAMDFPAEGGGSQQGVLDDLAGGKIDAKEAAARLKTMMKQGGA